MFQYAAGKALAIRLGTELVLEGLAPDSRKKSRTQILDSFKINCRFRPITSRRFDKPWIKLARLGLPSRLRGLPLFVERGFHFNSKFLEINKPCYLLGGWLSYRYFEEIRPILLEDFGFKHTLSTSAKHTLSAINSSSCPVAVHVRRGDYVEDPRILARHGICTADYYEQATGYVRKQYPDATFFVFSDDIPRVAKELSTLGDLHYVQGNTQEEDLHLMSLCKHAIISNSTYGWWAAWLNRNPNKTVIAPQQWFGPELMKKHDISDLLPPDWTTL